MLDIVSIAHPAFIVLGSFVAYIVNSNFGIDPILIGVVMTPVFYLAGMRLICIRTAPRSCPPWCGSSDNEPHSAVNHP
jgi:branched-subunit amino acid ABC-type transport system permease component